MLSMKRYLLGLVGLVVAASVAYGASLLPNGKQQFLDSAGRPLAGGSVTFYVPNTTTLKDTYQDPGGTTYNANPVPLDSAGRAVIYGTGAYRQIVKDRLGNIIWDQLTSDVAATGSSSWGGTSAGSANAQTVTASQFTFLDGQSISFRAGYTNTAAVTLTPNGQTATNVVNDTSTGPVSLSGGEIVAGNIVTAVYSTASGSFHVTLPRNPIPTGSISDYAGTVAPAGYLLAAGQCVSRTTYAALFAVIGATYGACDGSTTFATPDLRGRVSAGPDAMGGSAASRLTTASGMTSGALAGNGGQQTIVQTLAQMPSHDHGGSTGSESAHTHPNVVYSITTVASSTAAPMSGSAGVGSIGTGNTGAGLAHAHSIPAVGGGQAMPIIQPTLVLNKIIKT